MKLIAGSIVQVLDPANDGLKKQVRGQIGELCKQFPLYQAQE